MPKKIFRLLVVDADRVVLRLLRELLSDYDLDSVRLEADTICNLASALVRLSEKDFDCCLLEIDLPDRRGPDAVRAVCGAAPNMTVIVYSGNDDVGVALECVRAGAESFLLKGSVDRLTLARAVLIVTERHRIWRDRLREAGGAPNVVRASSPEGG